jgi:hypothetical protein
MTPKQHLKLNPKDLQTRRLQFARGYRTRAASNRTRQGDRVLEWRRARVRLLNKRIKGGNT